jgi:hypothetical protein
MKREDWTSSNICIYCGAKVGDEHKDKCVIRSRTVVINVTVPLVVSVPENYTVENVNFKYNDSSFCSSNLQRDITHMFNHLKKLEDDKVPEVEYCLCFRPEHTVRYIREATENDELQFGVYVKELPT